MMLTKPELCYLVKLDDLIVQFALSWSVKVLGNPDVADD